MVATSRARRSRPMHEPLTSFQGSGWVPEESGSGLAVLMSPHRSHFSLLDLRRIGRVDLACRPPSNATRRRLCRIEGESARHGRLRSSVAFPARDRRRFECLLKLLTPMARIVLQLLTQPPSRAASPSVLRLYAPGPLAASPW